jgi:hypothetical protein
MLMIAAAVGALVSGAALLALKVWLPDHRPRQCRHLS